jgi:hypothetical protein
MADANQMARKYGDEFYLQGTTLRIDTTKLGLTGYAPQTRTIATVSGSGLTGGGDLTADRSLAVVFGTTSGTVCQGNDARLTVPGTGVDGSDTYGNALQVDNVVYVGAKTISSLTFAVFKGLDSATLGQPGLPVALVGGAGKDTNGTIAGSNGGDCAIVPGTGGAGDATHSAGNGGSVTASAGSGGTANGGPGGNGGNYSIDAGHGTGSSGTNGTLSLGASNARTVTLGNNSCTLVVQGTWSSNLAFSAINHSITFLVPSSAGVAGAGLTVSGSAGAAGSGATPGGTGGGHTFSGGTGGAGTGSAAAGAGGNLSITSGAGGADGGGGGAKGGDITVTAGASTSATPSVISLGASRGGTTAQSLEIHGEYVKELAGHVTPRTATKTSSYSIQTIDQYIPTDSSGGAFPVLLPAANSVPPGWRVRVKDRAGACGTHAVTVTLAGADTADLSGTSPQITTNFGTAKYVSDGVSNWEVLP